MNGLPLVSSRLKNLAPIGQAVHRNKAVTRQGLLERLFSLMFSGLVYPQIWEDPIPDVEALALKPDSHLVTIASGGCNVLSYLTANPSMITAVDLNHAHIALNELKQKALCHLPSSEAFRQFFQEAENKDNIALYEQWLAPELSASTRGYWETLSLRGRRITVFTRNIYRYGLLGKWIGVGHAMARIYGIDLAGLLTCKNQDEQRAYFDQHIAPIFDKRLIRFLTDSPISLYGLGIPPAQYNALAEGQPMADILCERLRHLAAGFPLKNNYFAWQAFQRAYPAGPEEALPLYLQQRHFDTLRARADRIRLQRRSVTEALRGQPRSTVDGVVLLDAQDWMTTEQLNDLWQAIAVACRPGARIVFRTAGRASILPGRVEEPTLARFDYDDVMSEAMLAKDRSAIYGGFHLYRLKG